MIAYLSWSFLGVTMVYYTCVVFAPGTWKPTGVPRFAVMEIILGIPCFKLHVEFNRHTLRRSNIAVQKLWSHLAKKKHKSTDMVDVPQPILTTKHPSSWTTGILLTPGGSCIRKLPTDSDLLSIQQLNPFFLPSSSIPTAKSNLKVIFFGVTLG